MEINVVFINNEIDDLLIKGLKYSKSAKKDSIKVELLRNIEEILKKYFKNDKVKVKLSFDKNFKDFASILISGDDIKIFDNRVLKLLNEHASYANVYIEEGKIFFELTFSGLLNRKVV